MLFICRKMGTTNDEDDDDDNEENENEPVVSDAKPMGKLHSFLDFIESRPQSKSFQKVIFWKKNWK